MVGGIPRRRGPIAPPRAGRPRRRRPGEGAGRPRRGGGRPPRRARPAHGPREPWRTAARPAPPPRRRRWDLGVERWTGRSSRTEGLGGGATSTAPTRPRGRRSSPISARSWRLPGPPSRRVPARTAVLVAIGGARRRSSTGCRAPRRRPAGAARPCRHSPCRARRARRSRRGSITCCPFPGPC